MDAGFRRKAARARLETQSALAKNYIKHLMQQLAASS
jgi:hypothetical protein